MFFVDMSRKFVLIPIQTFTELCSQTKKSGDTITGVLKTFPENANSKATKKSEKRY